MDILYFLASFLLIRRLIRAIKFSVVFPKWRNLLRIASWGIWLLYAFCIGSLVDEARDFIGSLVLLGILYYINKEKDFQSQKPYIKANLPLKICFRVTSAVNSQIVLDESGAEKLLGKGDLLCDRGRGLERAQGPFIPQAEFLKVMGA